MEEQKLSHEQLAKYFAPMGKTSQIVGGVIAAIGLVGVMLGGFYMYIGVCVLAVGVAILFIRRDSRASDSEIDAAIDKRIGDIEYWAGREVSVREKLLNAFPQERFGEFEFETDENDAGQLLMIRGRQDKRLRTNVYTSTVVLFAQEILHIYKHTVCLSRDHESVEKLNERYVDLSSVELERKNISAALTDSKRGGRIDVPACRVLVKDNAGRTLISFPVTDGADIDRFVDSLNRLIANRKAAASESKAE